MRRIGSDEAERAEGHAGDVKSSVLTSRTPESLSLPNLDSAPFSAFHCFSISSHTPCVCFINQVCWPDCFNSEFAVAAHCLLHIGPNSRSISATWITKSSVACFKQAPSHLSRSVIADFSGTRSGLLPSGAIAARVQKGKRIRMEMERSTTMTTLARAMMMTRPARAMMTTGTQRRRPAQ